MNVKLSKIESNLIALAADRRDMVIAQANAAFNTAVQPVLDAHEVPKNAQVNLTPDGELVVMEWTVPDA